MGLEIGAIILLWLVVFFNFSLQPHPISLSKRDADETLERGKKYSVCRDAIDSLAPARPLLILLQVGLLPGGVVRKADPPAVVLVRGGLGWTGEQLEDAGVRGIMGRGMW